MAAAEYSYGTFNFKLEIKGIIQGHFQSVTGLSHEIEVLAHQEGGVNDRQHKLPGPGKFPNITLKLGYVASELAEDWHFNFAANPSSIGRKNGSIVLLNDSLEEVARWNFTRAWPVKWEGPEMNSTADNQAIETLEIAHEGLVREGARRPAAAGASAGFSVSFGVSASLSGGISVNASASASLGAGAGAQAGFQAQAGIQASAGASAGLSAGASAGAAAKAQAQLGAKASAGASAGAGAGAAAGGGAKAQAGFQAKIGS